MADMYRALWKDGRAVKCVITKGGARINVSVNGVSIDQDDTDWVYFVEMGEIPGSRQVAALGTWHMPVDEIAGYRT